MSTALWPISSTETALTVVCEAVYSAVCHAGSAGMTLLEYCAEENLRRRVVGDWQRLSPHDVSGRFTELSKAGRIVKVMRDDTPPRRLTRDGAGVWLADIHASRVASSDASMEHDDRRVGTQDHASTADVLSKPRSIATNYRESLGTI